MKVLYVIDSLAPGGTERSTIVLVPRLRELGVDATIVTLRSDEHELTGEANANGINVLKLEAESFPGRIRELRRLVRSGEFDIVHTALFKADQVGRIAAWGTGVPVISSLVNTPYDESRLADPNVKKWKLRVVQTIDSITGRLMVERFHAVSEGVKEANARSLRVSPARIVVAERGRDVTTLGSRTEHRCRSARAALDLQADAQVVLNLGRQDHQKAQSVLIKAASILSVSHPNLIVLIAGKDGSASAEIRHCLAEDPRAAAHVRLLGHRSDMGDLLCAADVLVISSRFEGTAGAALEAMALSTPIVSTDLVGLRGVLENDRNSVLVPAGDAADLAAGVARLLDDPALAERLATIAHDDFTSRFTLDAAAARLRDLYACVSPPRP
jgi:glycosyltransferase involved in cell wall biosynthesis